MSNGGDILLGFLQGVSGESQRRREQQEKTAQTLMDFLLRGRLAQTQAELESRLTGQRQQKQAELEARLKQQFPTAQEQATQLALSMITGPQPSLTIAPSAPEAGAARLRSRFEQLQQERQDRLNALLGLVGRGTATMQPVFMVTSQGTLQPVLFPTGEPAQLPGRTPKVLTQPGGAGETAVEQQTAITGENISDIINEMQPRFERLQTIKRGPKAIARGLTLGVRGALQYEPEAATYNAFREAVKGQIARVISLERGMMTNQDIKRIDNAIPPLTDSLETGREKFGLFESIVISVVQNAINRARERRGEPTITNNEIRQRLGFTGVSQGKPQLQSFSSEQEALAANLPSGTTVLINGRRARID